MYARATVVLIALVCLAWTAVGRAETVLVLIRHATAATSLFSEQGELKVGQTKKSHFKWNGKTYIVVLSAVERSKAEQQALGVTTPRFELKVYDGQVRPQKLVASEIFPYPEKGRNADCGIGTASDSPFQITYGLATQGSPLATCEKLAQMSDDGRNLFR